MKVGSIVNKQQQLFLQHGIRQYLTISLSISITRMTKDKRQQKYQYGFLNEASEGGDAQSWQSLKIADSQCLKRIILFVSIYHVYDHDEPMRSIYQKESVRGHVMKNLSNQQPLFLTFSARLSTRGKCLHKKSTERISACF